MSASSRGAAAARRTQPVRRICTRWGRWAVRTTLPEVRCDRPASDGQVPPHGDSPCMTPRPASPRTSRCATRLVEGRPTAGSVTATRRGDRYTRRAPGDLRRDLADIARHGRLQDNTTACRSSDGPTGEAAQPLINGFLPASAVAGTKTRPTPGRGRGRACASSTTGDTNDGAVQARQGAVTSRRGVDLRFETRRHPSGARRPIDAIRAM